MQVPRRVDGGRAQPDCASAAAVTAGLRNEKRGRWAGGAALPAAAAPPREALRAARADLRAGVWIRRIGRLNSGLDSGLDSGSGFAGSRPHLFMGPRGQIWMWDYDDPCSKCPAIVNCLDGPRVRTEMQICMWD